MNATRLFMLFASAALAASAGAAATSPAPFIPGAAGSPPCRMVVEDDEDRQTFEGVIKQIDETARSIMLEDAEGRIVTVTWDDDTAFSLNGESSTRDKALEVGRSATVKYDHNHVADSVDVSQKESGDDRSPD